MTMVMDVWRRAIHLPEANEVLKVEMVLVSLSRGGGSLLLSCCSRNSGASASRCLLPPLYSYNHSALKGVKLQKGSWSCDGVLKSGALSLSHCIYSLNEPKRSSSAAFCTISNVADSSAITTVPSTDSLTGDSDVDMTKMKDVANTLDIRVGRILKAWRHEEADSLYVEEVDIGEPEPRIICSGLVKYVPMDYLQGRNVIVLANLKPRNMRGVKSSGMLMCASDAPHENVELLEPPEGSLPGERVWFGSEEDKENLPEAASPNQIQKKKIWEQVQPHLRTDDSCVAGLGAHVMRTLGGAVACKSLKMANVS